MRIQDLSSRPVTPGSLQGMVVVPSYDEEYGMLPLLRSVVEQEVARDIAVTVVVNNARDTAAAVLESNARTIAMLQGLQTDEPPGDLLERSREDEYAYFLLQEFRAVARSELRLLLVDASSGGHAPERCNVGIARTMGGNAALSYLASGAQLYFTDADSRFAPAYMGAAEEVYRDDAVAGATGPVRSVPDDFHPEQKTLRTMDQIRAVIHACYCSVLRIRGIPDLASRKTHLMSGANLSVRGEVFAGLGGIPPLAGGEDIRFSLAMVRAGHRIGHDDRMTVFTQPRPSERAEAGHSFGQRLLQVLPYAASVALLPVRSWECERAIHRFGGYLGRMRHLVQDQRAWQETILLFSWGSGVPALSPEEAGELRQAMLLAPEMEQPWDNDVILVAMRRMATERFPHIPLQDAARDIESLIDAAPPGVIKRMRMLIGTALDFHPAQDYAHFAKDGDVQPAVRRAWHHRARQLKVMTEAMEMADVRDSTPLRAMESWASDIRRDARFRPLQELVARDLPELRDLFEQIHAIAYAFDMDAVRRKAIHDMHVSPALRGQNMQVVHMATRCREILSGWQRQTDDLAIAGLPSANAYIQEVTNIISGLEQKLLSSFGT